MANDLTVKQQKFVKYYLETGNATASALKAGYSCWHSGFENLRKPKIKHFFQQLLDEKGITDHKLSQVLKEGLDATKVVGYLNNQTNGTQKVSDEFVEVPDYPTRHRYLDTALKLKEKINGHKENGEGATTNITTVVIQLPNGEEKESYKALREARRSAFLQST